jgi:hypothetical protein
MQPETYIVFFVIAGLAWTGAALVAAAVWYFFMKTINPMPKPTEWDQEWEKIEDNLRK